MPTVNEFDRLLEAVSHAKSYPTNGCGVDVQEYQSKAQLARLRTLSEDLFCADGEARLELVDVFREDEDYYYRQLQTSEALDQYLRQSSQRQRRTDPQQRFIFVTAPSSRDALWITEEMMLQLLTYHQVMPAFLDFWFQFGFQSEPRDPHFSRFRGQSYLDLPRRKLSIPQLDRSGRYIEMCYSLKSVEPTTDAQQWSIRPCSVHHKFDIVHQQATWIIIQANGLVRDAVQEKLKSTRTDMEGLESTPPSRLASSLDVHRLLCDWAGQNWHDYIGDLEHQFESETEEALFNPQDGMGSSSDLSNAASPDVQRSVDAPRRVYNKPLQYLSEKTRRMTSSIWRGSTLQGGEHIDLNDLTEQQQPPIIDVHCVPESYTFSHLQRVQLKEDKAHEIVLVIDGNCKVIEHIRLEYMDIASSLDVDTATRDACRAHLMHFQRHLAAVQQDMDSLRARLQTILQKAASRRSLIQASIDYRNMQATQRMTNEMHRIAHKTAVETISMRVITFVTLIFLPGTFVSTLMSTPIVSFNGTPSGFSLENIGLGALELYIVVSLPLFCLTVIAVLMCYLPERRKEAQKMQKITDPYSENV